jgi:anti-sigma B factor antagonist
MWMDNEMFDYKKIDRDDISILYLRGDLNALSADQLRKVINDVILSKHLKVIVEVSSLELIDSSGLGALVSLFKRMRSVCGHLKIVGLQGQPLELFQLLDLHKVFDLVNNIEDAMEQFQGKYNREESAIHLTEQSVSWPK